MYSLWKRTPGEDVFDKQPGCSCLLSTKDLSGAFIKGGEIHGRVQLRFRALLSGSLPRTGADTHASCAQTRGPGPPNNPSSNRGAWRGGEMTC